MILAADLTLTSDQVLWAIFIISSLLSVVFKLLNIAFDSASWPAMEERLKDRKKTERLEKIVDRSDSIVLTLGLLSLAMTLISFASLTKLLPYELGIWKFVVAGGVCGFLRFFIPETYGRRLAEEIVIKTGWIASLTAWMFYPVTQPVVMIQEMMNKKIRGKTEEDEAEEVIDQIMKHADEGAKEGVIEEEERDMIESIIELRDTSVSEIMTPRTEMFSINIEAEPEEIIKQVVESGHSRIPVYEENRDNIVGILYGKDMLGIIHERKTLNLKDILREPYYIPETKPINELFHEFRKRKIHIAVAMDEYGGTAGLVTFEDIIEEIFGEIIDEHDTEEAAEPYIEIDENTVQVDARLDIDTLNEKFKVNLPEDEDFETVGGFVTSFLGEIPIKGFSFEYPDDKLAFKIIDATKRKLIRLKIEKLQEA